MIKKQVPQKSVTATIENDTYFFHRNNTKGSLKAVLRQWRVT